MTTPLKIQCACGQRYAFDAESEAGRITTPVACPVCGADGTDAANATLAQNTAPVPSIAVLTGATPARITTSPHAAARLPGQVEADQALHEARAKISWGDEPKAVIAYLVVQGFTRDAATELVDEMFRERLTVIRNRGWMKAASGAALLGVAVAGYFLWSAPETSRAQSGRLAFVIGLVLAGLWLLVNGLAMVIAPKSESGDAVGE